MQKDFNDLKLGVKLSSEMKQYGVNGKSYCINYTPYLIGIDNIITITPPLIKSYIFPSLCNVVLWQPISYANRNNCGYNFVYNVIFNLSMKSFTGFVFIYDIKTEDSQDWIRKMPSWPNLLFKDVVVESVFENSDMFRLRLDKVNMR